jgi:hypothetical protein
VEISAETLALEYGWKLEPGAEDRLYLAAALGYGSANANAAFINRTWNAAVGSLNLGYEWPLWKYLSITAEASLWGLLGPQDFDALAFGSFDAGLRQSF